MGLILSIGWWLVGVPYWLLLGMLSGMLNLVPFMAVVGFVAAVGLSLVDSLAGQSVASGEAAQATQAAFSWWVIIAPTIVYAVAQGVDGWVVEPIVQSKATDLDPLTVLLAVVIGGALAGLLGLIVAIPVTACLKILAQEELVPRLRGFVQKPKE